MVLPFPPGQLPPGMPPPGMPPPGMPPGIVIPPGAMRGAMPPPGMPPGGMPQFPPMGMRPPMPGAMPGAGMPSFPPQQGQPGPLTGMALAGAPMPNPGIPAPPIAAPPMLPPPPPPAPPEPALPDLEAAMTEFRDTIAREDKGITYRPGYKPPPKPSVGQIIDWARQDFEYWQPAYAEVVDDRALINRTKIGSFPNDHENPDYSPWYDSALADDFKLINDYLAALPTRPKLEYYSDTTLRQPTQECEDTCRWWLNEAGHRYAEQGNGVLAHDVSFFGMATAMYVMKIVPNFNDPAFPWMMRLLDPLTVYPVFTDRLVRVTHRSEATISQVIGAYENGNGDVTRKMLKHATNYHQTNNLHDHTGKGNDTLLHHTCNVTEFWDEKWFALIVNDEVIVAPTAHDLGYVPFVVQPVSTGMPMSARTPVDLNAYKAYARHDPTTWTGAFSGLPSQYIWHRDQMRHKLQTFMRAGKLTHHQKESILGRFFTEIRKSDDPATIHKRNPDRDDDGSVRFRTESGWTNDIEVDEEVIPFQPAPSQQIVGPILGTMSRNEATHLSPPNAYGVIEGSNNTGVAMEGLNETGKDRINVYVIAESLFYGRCLAMMLTQIMDVGDKMGQDGSRGSLLIPSSRPRPGEPGAFELKPETVRKVSRGGTVRVKVTKTSYKLSSLGPILNAANMGVQGRFFSRRFVQEQIGIEDPDYMLNEMLEEEAMNSESVLKVKTYQALRKADPESAEIFAMLELAPIMQQLQAGAMGAPPPGGPGQPPAPGGPPPMALPSPPTGGPNGMPPTGGQMPQMGGNGLPGGMPGPMGGVSMPQMGSPAGQQGGRPMGS